MQDARSGVQASVSLRADVPNAAPVSDSARHNASLRVVVAVLAVAAVVHVALVVTVHRDERTLGPDETVSHMTASGNVDDFPASGVKPAGTWVRASQVRDYLEVDDHSGLGETRQNLADYDIRPPMFFWALFGVKSAGLGTRWSGPVLNLFAVFVAGALLFLLAIELLGDRVLAALAVAIFAFSPALIRATGFARQYPMLMLASVLLIAATTRLERRPTSKWCLLGYIAAGTFGLLVSSNFVFALLGALLVVAGRCFENKRAVVSVLLATIASAALAFAIFPSYPKQYARLNTILSVSPENTQGLGERVRAWVLGLYDYITIDTSFDRILDLIVLVGAVVVVATSPLWYRNAWNIVSSRPVGLAALGVGGVSLVGLTAAYVLGRTPYWASGWQYIILFWPAIVLLFAMFVAKLARPALILALVAALLGACAWQWQRDWRTNFTGDRRATEAVDHATLVVSFCPRGYVTGAAMWMPPDTPFLLAGWAGAPIPPVPADADRSSAFLLDGGRCRGSVNVDQLLATLGFVRGRRAGSFGDIQLSRLNPLPAVTEIGPSGKGAVVNDYSGNASIVISGSVVQSGATLTLLPDTVCTPPARSPLRWSTDCREMSSGTTAFIVALRDGNDTFTANDPAVRVTVLAGPGADKIFTNDGVRQDIDCGGPDGAQDIVHVDALDVVHNCNAKDSIGA